MEQIPFIRRILKAYLGGLGSVKSGHLKLFPGQDLEGLQIIPEEHYS